MADRLERAVRRAGLGEAAAAAIVDTLNDAFDARADIRDTHDPAWLHPARNALILLEDLDVSDPVELCAALHFDATRPVAARIADDGVRALVHRVPRADDDPERLLEDLVGADAACRRIALADRLDHARHLHLGPRERWAPFHAETRDVWLPVAERTHPTLARRLRWWTGMFQRRWLRAPRP